MNRSEKDGAEEVNSETEDDNEDENKNNDEEGDDDVSESIDRDEYIYQYDDEPERKLTKSLIGYSSKMEKKLQKLLATYQERDQDFKYRTEARIDKLCAYIKREKQATRQERADWEAEKVKIASTYGLEPDVNLCVGGQFFATTLTTLRRFPDTMIGVMFSGRHTLQKNKKGAIIIDRDGTHFRHILNFLRNPAKYTVDHLSSSETFELKHEADYYGLGDLMFPTKEVFKTTSGRNVVLTQEDDGIWSISEVSNKTKVIICPHCKAGFDKIPASLILPGFARSRKIVTGQPTKCGQCPSCRSYY